MVLRQDIRMMENKGTKGIPYEIPAHVAYAGRLSAKSGKRKSKYFDLQRDTEVGLHLGNMEKDGTKVYRADMQENSMRA